MPITERIAEYLESHMMTCTTKQMIGIDCMGCGMQRSIVHLLRGNIYESFLLFPALMPITFMLFFLLLHVLFKFKYGAQILLVLFIMNVLILVISYILKLNNIYHFF